MPKVHITASRLRDLLHSWEIICYSAVRNAEYHCFGKRRSSGRRPGGLAHHPAEDGNPVLPVTPLALGHVDDPACPHLDLLILTINDAHYNADLLPRSKDNSDLRLNEPLGTGRAFWGATYRDDAVVVVALVHGPHTTEGQDHPHFRDGNVAVEKRLLVGEGTHHVWLGGFPLPHVHDPPLGDAVLAVQLVFGGKSRRAISGKVPR